MEKRLNAAGHASIGGYFLGNATRYGRNLKARARLIFRRESSVGCARNSLHAISSCPEKKNWACRVTVDEETGHALVCIENADAFAALSDGR